MCHGDVSADTLPRAQPSAVAMCQQIRPRDTSVPVTHLRNVAEICIRGMQEHAEELGLC